MESQLLKKGCKAFHNLVTTYLFRSPLPAMGFSTGYFSSLKQATDATTFLPFTWKTPRDSSFSVCVCGADTLWAASRPLEMAYWLRFWSQRDEFTLWLHHSLRGETGQAT